MRLNKVFKRKLAKYFKDRLGMWDYRRGWMKGTCPSCGKDKKFGVSIQHNRTNCFRCGYNPDPLGVIVDLELEVDNFAQARLFIHAFEEADYLETPQEFLPERDVTLPEGYVTIAMGQGSLGKKARAYMESRGFDIYELAMKGVGYCRKGRYWGRIIFPFYEAGNIVYMNARKFIGGGRKFDNPKIDDFGIGKSMLIYNIDALQTYNTIYITESVTNALTIGDDAVAGGGKVFSSYQISKLLQSPVSRFIIILDPDAYEEAIWLSMHLVNHREVKLVNLPKKVYLRKTKKTISVDVNSLGRDITLKYVNKSKWLSFGDLLNMKMSHERTQYSHN